MLEDDQDADNYETFRDCVFAAVTQNLAPAATKTQGRKSVKVANTKSGSLPDQHDHHLDATQNQPDPSELADFSDYVANEIFYSLPANLRSLTHETIKNDVLSDKYSLPLTLSNLEDISTSIPASVTDTLTSYSLINPPSSDLQSFLAPILSSYISSVIIPPPPPSTTRTTECELCGRSWIPLTYHHLIPRSTHERALKRNWHPEALLQSVAWLCRACHSFVHRMASNEELAKEWFTIERIEARDDVQKWTSWIGRVRWKKT